jgi:hypothetical protein
MGVTLVRDVPDNVIFWHIKDVMECNGKLIDSERGGKVTASFGNGLECFPS